VTEHNEAFVLAQDVGDFREGCVGFVAGGISAVVKFIWFQRLAEVQFPA
jgi:hypothetical protein